MMDFTRHGVRAVAPGIDFGTLKNITVCFFYMPTKYLENTVFGFKLFPLDFFIDLFFLLEIFLSRNFSAVPT